MLYQMENVSNNHHNINTTKYFMSFNPVEHNWKDITLQSRYPVIVVYGKSSDTEHFLSKLYDKYDLSVIFMNNSDEDTESDNKVIYLNIYNNGKVLFIGNSSDPDYKIKVMSFFNKDY